MHSCCFCKLKKKKINQKHKITLKKTKRNAFEIMKNKQQKHTKKN